MRTGLREARKYLLILNFNNMGKLYDRLQKQLKSEEYKKDAEDCLKIYEKLKEMNNGKVWESSWNPLTTIKFVGTYPNSERIYKPSQEGYVFLKGIEEKKEREAGVRYISVQMAIMSHLSDAQDISSAYEYSTSAHDHINFAKQLVLTYPDTSIEVSENELNELWKKTIQ
nr:MAG TPA_asm: hypothetical protein [Caudoviricetes sp.]